MHYISEINKIDRFVEVPLRGALCDLLWADPLKDCQAVRGEFWPNKERDCSVYYGKKPTKKFLHVNKLTCVVRGHQVNVEGYKMHKWDGPNCAPLVITVFSAPNYCGYYDNKAAILYLNSNSKLSVRQFKQSEAPYRLPGNQDAISWSMPFLAQKIMQLLFCILSKVGNDGVDSDEEQVSN